MLAEFGPDTVEHLKELSRQSKKWTCEALAELKIDFMELVRKLKAKT
jgi:hypothetical protein